MFQISAQAKYTHFFIKCRNINSFSKKIYDIYKSKYLSGSNIGPTHLGSENIGKI